MKKVLFVNPGQFGSITDTYFYCLNLKDLYSVSYFGIFEEDSSVKCEGIDLIHLKLPFNSILRKIIFIWELFKFLKNNYFDYIIINYFLGSSIVTLFGKGKVNIDIRTGAISRSNFKSFILNFVLSVEVRMFDRISCISSSLSSYLNLPNRTHILPLGAPLMPLFKKDFSVLKILYVGTFKERNIEKTVYAFSKFISSLENKKIATYTIIGFGSEIETQRIKDAIFLEGMQDNIFFLGKVRFPELYTYLQENNVGMSYIPIKKCFDNQPPTKTFEYLLSGMIVLATGTKENIKVINDENGRITDDSIDSICEGLKIIFNNRMSFNSTNIQVSSKKFSWEYIVKSNLHEYIKKG